MYIRMQSIVLALVSLLLPACDAAAQSVARRRAVLIGINDYTASTLARVRPPAPQARVWPNLGGAVNDVNAMKEMLVLLHGFDARDVLTLTDQQATRRAILQGIEQHLAKSAASGDVLLFYFAGHGSQRKNSLSDEQDQLDETIVPADSRLGAADIRDKELRPIFNRILDRGARLTVLLDHCHSGSGARGLSTGARPRGIKPDLRDVADRTIYGPRPEERGALVIAATQDTDTAWETMDDQKKMHGAFSWAWIRAMRDASADESAVETFTRAAARLRAERPYQEPVIAGSADVMHSPFLSARIGRRGERAVLAVEKVTADGTVLLQGGWAHGLAIGTQLRVLSDRNTTVRLTITRLLGLGRSEGRIPTGRPMPQSIRSGALMEIVGWAAPAGRPLRVWMPRVSDDVAAIASLARKLYKEASRRHVRWIDNPLDTAPSHLLRRGSREWELLGPDGDLEFLGPDPANTLAAVAKLPASSSLFVQLPAPSAWIDDIDVGPGSDREGIVPADRAEEADYILAGRYTSSRLSYAWVRPATKSSDRRKSGLPVQTGWVVEDHRHDPLRDMAGRLRENVMRLRRMHAWHLLESPPSARFPYRLCVRRERDGEWTHEAAIGDEKYALYLRAPKAPVGLSPRYVYIFTIDSAGRAFLLFGTSSVENRFPRPGNASSEISLGPTGTFHIAPPYGVDTYFLLTTDEPLANPRILEWDGVRSGSPVPRNALEELLMLTASDSRAPRPATPSTWSIERLYLESVPPRDSKPSR